MSIKKAIIHLQTNDPVLSEIIGRVGKIRLTKREDHFRSLVGSIISQQLSTKAASTIFTRLTDKLNNDISPRTLTKIKVSELRKLGISNQKSEFIINLANFVIDNPDFFKSLHELSNEQVVSELTKIRGIGEWTAQMFLIFSLKRLNVLPLNDAGLHRSINVHYKPSRKSNEKYMKRLAVNWGDYSSIAAIYLWRGIDQ